MQRVALPVVVDESIRLWPIDPVVINATDPGRVPRVAPGSLATGAATAASLVDPVDFSDPESQRVLTAAARVVARELGREAAQEYFAELLHSSRVPE